MFKNNIFFKTSLYLFIALFSYNNILLACDTTPSLTVSNVIDNGDGTFYMDITACIGSEGSADGFDLYFNNNINIIGTTVTEVTSTGSGNTAEVSVNNGIWLAYFDEYNPTTNSPYFEAGAWGLDCIEFGVIVDDNPEGATLCSAGMNEDCLGWTFDDVFITCAVIPGPCLPNYFITDNGSIDSDVSIAGQNCNFAPFNDEIIELTVTCDGDFNFSLTQDASIGWPGESWLTIAVGCCSGVIEQTSSFGFLEPTITIDTYLTIGTYYVIVDIEGNGFPGDYILDITSSADLSLITTAFAGNDQLTCEDNTLLSGNEPANNEFGNWTVVDGSGIFIDANDPNTIVNNLSNGNNIFQWEIANECSNSTDQVIIEVANNLTFNIPDIVYCLDPISLEAIGVVGGSGEWSVTPEFNVEIDDVNSSSTFANVTAYGTYNFTYTICEDEFSTSVNVESIPPTLSSNSNTYSCLESFSLSADVNGDPGYWESEGPFIANIDNPTSLNPTINVNGYGTYVFTYYGCGTSSSIEINMNGDKPTVFGDEETYCLEPFELTADVNGDPGYWDFEGPGNAVFSNQASLTTNVTVDEYGIYEFTYYGCGEASEPFIVNSLSAKPQILQPIETLDIYCELSTTLESYVLGDPGFWEFEGPGNAVFTNQDSENTMVNVDQYGTYLFMYYGCGTMSDPVTINFEALQPSIDVDEIMPCELTTNLTGTVEGSGNVEWFINSSPSGSYATFSNPTSLDTEITVSDYGVYEIGLTGCGSTIFKDIHFESSEPHIIAPDFQNCILTATLIAYTGDPSGGGPWTQQSGTPGVMFSNPMSNVTDVTVPDFGLYTFAYEGCDEISSISIGFECPLVFPNVITPNGDNNNDIFFIRNLNTEIYSQSIMTIYNRWGLVVYSKAGYGIDNEWWDGNTTYENRAVTDGVYYYILEIFNNVTEELEKHTGELNVFKSNSSSSNESKD